MTLPSEREPLKVITKIADFKEEGLVSPEGREGKKGILKCAKGKSIDQYTNCVQLKTMV